METKYMANNQNIPVKIKYDSKSAVYANQFIVNQSPEEIFLDLSSGPVPDSVTGQTIVPIHTRIALSYPGAQRLGELLVRSAKNHQLLVKSNKKKSN